MARGLVAVTDGQVALHSTPSCASCSSVASRTPTTRHERPALPRPQAVRPAPLGRGAVRRRGREDCGLRHRGHRSRARRPPSGGPDEQPPALGRRRAIGRSRGRPDRLRRERGSASERTSSTERWLSHAGRSVARWRSRCARSPRRWPVGPSDGPLADGEEHAESATELARRHRGHAKELSGCAFSSEFRPRPLT